MNTKITTTTVDNRLQASTIGGMSKVMTLRMPDDVAAALKEYAEGDLRSQAQVVVMALRYFLASHAGRSLAEMKRSGEVGSLAGIQIEEESGVETLPRGRTVGRVELKTTEHPFLPATEASDVGDKHVRDAARMRKKMDAEDKKSAGVPKVADGSLAVESTSTEKPETPVSEVTRQSGRCVHGSERKHCVQCEITARKLGGKNV